MLIGVEILLYIHFCIFVCQEILFILRTSSIRLPKNCLLLYLFNTLQFVYDETIAHKIWYDMIIEIVTQFCLYISFCLHLDFFGICIFWHLDFFALVFFGICICSRECNWSLMKRSLSIWSPEKTNKMIPSCFCLWCYSSTQHGAINFGFN